MKENNNRGSMVVLTIIGIATLLVAVIGATFAYFSVTVKYKNEPTPAVVETSTMLITFEQKNEINYTGAIPGRPSLYDGSLDEEYPGLQNMADNANNTLKFTLTSAPTMVLNAPYNIYLVIDDNDEAVPEGTELTEEEIAARKENDFVTNNLVYLITQSTRPENALATQNQTYGTDGKQYFGGEENNLFVKDDYNGDGQLGDNEYVGVINHQLKAGDKILIATGNIGSHGSFEEWTFEIWLRETGANQNEDQGKVFKGHIEIEPVNQDPITYESEKVTTQ